MFSRRLVVGISCYIRNVVPAVLLFVSPARGDGVMESHEEPVPALRSMVPPTASPRSVQSPFPECKEASRALVVNEPHASRDNLTISPERVGEVVPKQKKVEEAPIPPSESRPFVEDVVIATMTTAGKTAINAQAVNFIVHLTEKGFHSGTLEALKANLAFHELCSLIGRLSADIGITLSVAGFTRETFNTLLKKGIGLSLELVLAPKLLEKGASAFGSVDIDPRAATALNYQACALMKVLGLHLLYGAGEGSLSDALLSSVWETGLYTGVESLSNQAASEAGKWIRKKAPDSMEIRFAHALQKKAEESGSEEDKELANKAMQAAVKEYGRLAVTLSSDEAKFLSEKAGPVLKVAINTAAAALAQYVIQQLWRCAWTWWTLEQERAGVL